QEDGEHVGQEIAEREAFREEEHGDSPCSLDRPVAGIARRLSIFCCLRHAPDPCGRNSRASPLAWQRTHAFSGCIAGREARRKLSRTVHDESAARRFDVRSPGLQLLHAMDLPVHPFQRGRKYLLALEGMFGSAGKASASRHSFSARGTANVARQRSFLVAHIAQTLAQRLEVIEASVIDFGMMTAQDDLMLVVAENAPLELARDGHELPVLLAAVSCTH